MAKRLLVSGAHLSTVVSCLCLALTPSIMQGAQHNDKVPLDVRAAWDEFLRKFNVTQAVFANEARDPSTQQVVYRSETTMKCCRNSFLLAWDVEARCINEKYCFVIRRAAIDKPWTLTSLRLRQETSDLKDFEEWVAVQKTQHNFFPLGSYTFTLNELADLDGFRVLRAEPASPDANLLNLDFEIRDPKATVRAATIHIRRGRLTLDRNKSWLPIRRKFVWPGGNETLLELSDFVTENGITYPTVTRLLQQEKDGSESELGRTTARDVQVGGSIPEREFTLSYFGFPEPGDSPRRRPPYLWFAAAAVVMIALGLFLRTLVQARRD